MKQETHFLALIVFKIRSKSVKKEGEVVQQNFQDQSLSLLFESGFGTNCSILLLDSRCICTSCSREKNSRREERGRGNNTPLTSRHHTFMYKVVPSSSRKLRRRRRTKKENRRRKQTFSEVTPDSCVDIS